VYDKIFKFKIQEKLLFVNYNSNRIITNSTFIKSKLYNYLKRPYDPVKCCNDDGSTPEILPKECLQIRIPYDEPESKYRCLSIPRSLDTSDKGCNIKPVRQVS